MSGPGRRSAEAIAALLEHVNSHHDDAVDVLVRGHGAGLGLDAWRDEAHISEVDASGLTVVAGPWRERIRFRRPATSDADLALRFAEVVAEARGWLGIATPSSIERELAVPPALAFADVVRVTRCSPGMALITIAGPDLRTLAPPGPAASVYLLLPPEGRDTLTVDASFTWERWAAMPETERPAGAHYTIRAHRPEDGELDLAVVLHGGGPASRWAVTARPGRPVAVWGPREAFALPPATSSVVLLADEAGLPAVAAILDALGADGPGVPVRAIVELSGRGDRAVVARPDAVTWLDRGDAAPGTTMLLADAFAALDVDGGAYVWAGVERRTAKLLRHQARRVLGLARPQVCVEPYWAR